MAVSDEEKNADKNISRTRAVHKIPIGIWFKVCLYSLCFGLAGNQNAHYSAEA
ncbi:MAG: hypothetical protein ACI8PV_001112 [Dinoroseobacter sp.]|jgi:hypothetical protein